MSHSVVIVNQPENKPAQVDILVSDADIATAINVAVGRYKSIVGTRGLNEQILRNHVEKYHRIDFGDYTIQIKVA